VTVWTVLRFAHVLGACLWVGGQLLLSLVVLPLARKHLPEERRGGVLTAVGRRFALLTAALLPVQVGTGVALAAERGVTVDALGDPGYPRVLTAKLALLTVAMATAALHGVCAARGRAAAARVLVVASLLCSVGVVLLATALVG
jgi:uncharacterized membrane protein